jgi:hypothetical protein
VKHKKIIIMIFKKYENKINSSLTKKNKKILTKFYQKPIRNINTFINEYLINSNQSDLENKLKFNTTHLNKLRLLQITNLYKKKII